MKKAKIIKRTIKLNNGGREEKAAGREAVLKIKNTVCGVISSSSS